MDNKEQERGKLRMIEPAGGPLEIPMYIIPSISFENEAPYSTAYRNGIGHPIFGCDT
jgi:hypothetical protein